MLSPAGTGPVLDPVPGTVELVSADAHLVRWRWTPGVARRHTHPLGSAEVVDALEGLDAVDRAALRVAARWTPSLRLINPKPADATWAPPAPPSTLDVHVFVASLAGYQSLHHPIVILDDVAIWVAPRRDRELTARAVRAEEESRRCWE